MPFSSQKQRAFFYAKLPQLAAEWESETPKGKPLPKYKNEKPAEQPPEKTAAEVVLQLQQQSTHPLWILAVDKIANAMAMPTINPATPPAVTQPGMSPAAQGIIMPPTMAAAQTHPQAQGMGGPSMNPIQSFGGLSTTGEVNGNAGLGVQHSALPAKLARAERWLGIRN